MLVLKALSGLQECPDKRGKQECQARVSSKSVQKECQAKSVQKECLAGVDRFQEGLWRDTLKSRHNFL